MINITYEEIVAYIEDKGYESVKIFKEPTYETAFIGMTSDDKPVYDYDKMLEFLQKKHGMSIDEAMDFISFNDSFRDSDTPIILYKVEK